MRFIRTPICGTFLIREKYIWQYIQHKILFVDCDKGTYQSIASYPNAAFSSKLLARMEISLIKRHTLTNFHNVISNTFLRKGK